MVLYRLVESSLSNVRTSSHRSIVVSSGRRLDWLPACSGHHLVRLSSRSIVGVAPLDSCLL